MTDTIAIKYDSDGRIINRYIGSKDGESWTNTDAADWPDAEPGADELPRYYFDPTTGDITVEYETIERPDELE